nr:MAG TPA: hypothetical protein [Caudoviricetes sp.]
MIIILSWVIRRNISAVLHEYCTTNDWMFRSK